MKRITFLLCLVLIYHISFSQADTARKKIVQGTTKTQVTTTNKPATLRPTGDKNLATKMPDLKFSTLTVTAAATGTADTYNLSITYTVKNEGVAAILTDNVTLQGYLSDERWLTHGNKDLRMTGYLSAAGGQILSNVRGRGEMLNPGTTKQISYTLYNQVIPRDPKPIFIINAATGESETDKNNNMAYTYILL